MDAYEYSDNDLNYLMMFQIAVFKTVQVVWNVIQIEGDFGMNPRAKNSYHHWKFGLISLAEQRQIAKREVIVEDISGIESCPKCAGILRWGRDTRYEDAVSCIYCGWRPGARMAVELC